MSSKSKGKSKDPGPEKSLFFNTVASANAEGKNAYWASSESEEDSPLLYVPITTDAGRTQFLCGALFYLAMHQIVVMVLVTPLKPAVEFSIFSGFLYFAIMLLFFLVFKHNEENLQHNMIAVVGLSVFAITEALFLAGWAQVMDHGLLHWMLGINAFALLMLTAYQYFTQSHFTGAAYLVGFVAVASGAGVRGALWPPSSWYQFAVTMLVSFFTISYFIFDLQDMIHETESHKMEVEAHESLFAAFSVHMNCIAIGDHADHVKAALDTHAEQH